MTLLLLKRPDKLIPAIFTIIGQLDLISRMTVEIHTLKPFGPDSSKEPPRSISSIRNRQELPRILTQRGTSIQADMNLKEETLLKANCQT